MSTYVISRWVLYQLSHPSGKLSATVRHRSYSYFRLDRPGTLIYYATIGDGIVSLLRCAVYILYVMAVYEWLPLEHSIWL